MNDRNLVLEALKKEIQLSWLGLSLKQREDDILREYLATRLSVLNAKIGHLLAPHYTIKLGSVFVHQKPRVAPDCTSRECELGDLLSLFLFFSGGKLTFSNAHILQVKKNYSDLLKDHPRSETQVKLFEECAGFRMPKSVALPCSGSSITDRRWPVNWENRFKALSYLLLTNPLKKDEIAPTSIFIPAIYGYGMQWGSLVVSQMLNLMGLRYSLKPSGHACHKWSTIVWELITRVGIFLSKSLPRMYGINPLLQIASAFNRFDNPDRAYIEADGVDGGLNILLITVSDRKGLSSG